MVRDNLVDICSGIEMNGKFYSIFVYGGFPYYISICFKFLVQLNIQSSVSNQLVAIYK